MDEQKPKKISNIPAEALPERSVFIGVMKDKVAGMKIGDSIKISLSGEVAGMRETGTSAADKHLIEIELRGPKVLEVDSNTADMALKRMTQSK